MKSFQLRTNSSRNVGGAASATTPMRTVSSFRRNGSMPTISRLNSRIAALHEPLPTPDAVGAPKQLQTAGSAHDIVAVMAAEADRKKEADLAATTPAVRARAKVAAAELRSAVIAADVPDVTCCCLGVRNPFRAFFIALVHHQAFVLFISACVIANVVVLCMYQPLEPRSSFRNELVFQVSKWNSWILLGEMTAKMITFGLGLTHAKAYLRSAWNVADMGVVVLGMAWLVNSEPVFIGVRMYRLITSAAQTKGLRVVLDAASAAAPALVNVVILTVIQNAFFGLLGMQLWMGVLRGSCGYVDPWSGNATIPSNSPSCGLDCSGSPGGNCVPNWGDSCALWPALSPNGSAVMLVNSTCMAGANPGNGQVSFDNFGSAILTAYTLTTTEGWSSIMYRLWHNWGQAWLVTILFSVHTYLGAFLTAELALAVVWGMYSISADQKSVTSTTPTEAIVEFIDAILEDDLKNRIDKENGEIDSFVTDTPKCLWFLSAARMSLNDRSLPGDTNLLHCSWYCFLLLKEARRLAPKDAKVLHVLRYMNRWHQQLLRKVALDAAGIEPAAPGESPLDAPSRGGCCSSCGCCSASCGRAILRRASIVGGSGDGGAADSNISKSGSIDTRKGKEALPPASLPSQASMDRRITTEGSTPRNCCLTTRDRCRAFLPSMVAMWFKSFARWSCARCPSVPACCQARVASVVDTPAWRNVICAAIAANAIIFACDYEGMSHAMENGLMAADVGFIVFFVLEMLASAFAFEAGVLEYFLSSVAVAFDATIMAVSIIYAVIVVASFHSFEISGFIGFHNLSAIAELRLLRIFRIFRLLNVNRGLKDIVESLSVALPAVVDAVVLLFLFMLVMAVVGMQIFGSGYQAAVDAGVFASIPRMNFTSLWWGFVTVFQIMDNENWNDTLNQHMAAFGPSSSIFFLLIIGVGNMIFLNILLALLLSYFDRIHATDGSQGTISQASWRKMLSSVICCMRPLARSTTTSKRVAPLNASFPETSPTSTTTSNRSLVALPEASPEGGAGSGGGGSVELVALSAPASPKRPMPALSVFVVDEAAGNSAAAAPSARSLPAVAASAASPVASSAAKERPTLDARSKAELEASLTERICMSEKVSAVIMYTGSDLFPSIVEGYCPSLESVVETWDVADANVDLPKNLCIRVQVGGNVFVESADVAIKKQKRASRVSTTSSSRFAARSGRASLDYGAEAPPLCPLSCCCCCCSDAVLGCCNGALRCLWQMWRALRVCSGAIVEARPFEWLTLVFIAVSSINLALDSPGTTENCPSLLVCDTPLSSYLVWSDRIVAVFFVIEMLLQMTYRGICSPRACSSQSYGCGSSSADGTLDAEGADGRSSRGSRRGTSGGGSTKSSGKRAAADSYYFSESWRWLDFAIVIVSLVSVLTINSSVKAFRAVRGLRALRPLRMASQFPELRIVLESLVRSMPRAKDAAIIIFFASYLFAVIGMAIFRGRFYGCNDPSVSTWDGCTGFFNVTNANGLCGLLPTDVAASACNLHPLGVPFPRRLESYRHNFDSFSNALQTVLELISGENWPTLLLAGTDATGYHTFARRDSQPFNAVYYVLIELLLNMFMIELLSGVVVDTYHRMLSRDQNLTFLSEEQIKWIENVKMVAASRPARFIHAQGAFYTSGGAGGERRDSLSNGSSIRSLSPLSTGGRSPSRCTSTSGFGAADGSTPPPSPPPQSSSSSSESAAAAGGRAPFSWLRFRAWLSRFILSPTYRFYFAVLLTANLIVYALPYASGSAAWFQMTWTLDMWLVAMFALELLLHAIIGHGVVAFFSSPAHVLHVLSLAVSVAAVVFPTGLAGAFLRMLVVVRVLRLGWMNRKLSRILSGIIKAGPLFLNIIAILLLIFYIYSVVGMNLFNGVRRGAYLTKDANFDSFPNAVVLLVRSATGENFHEVLHDLAIAPPYCDPEVNCGVALWVSALFFDTFYALIAYIVMALFVAVVVEVEDVQPPRSDENVYLLSSDASSLFGALWGELDVSGSAFLPRAAVEFVVSQVPAPLGCHNPDAPTLRSPHLPPGAEMNVMNAVDLTLAKRIVSSLPLIPNDAGELHYSATLLALTERAYKKPMLGVHLRGIEVRGAAATSAEAPPIQAVTAAVLIQRAAKLWHKGMQKKRGRRDSTSTPSPAATPAAKPSAPPFLFADTERYSPTSEEKKPGSAGGPGEGRGARRSSASSTPHTSPPPTPVLRSFHPPVHTASFADRNIFDMIQDLPGAAGSSSSGSSPTIPNVPYRVAPPHGYLGAAAAEAHSRATRQWKTDVPTRRTSLGTAQPAAAAAAAPSAATASGAAAAAAAAAPSSSLGSSSALRAGGAGPVRNSWLSRVASRRYADVPVVSVATTVSESTDASDSTDEDEEEDVGAYVEPSPAHQH